MVKFSFLLILSLSFVLLDAGCGPRGHAQKNDTVLNAYRLIDDQRTDEAIAVLETALVNDRNNYEFKVVLASAYAHKAGIRIQKLVPAVVQINKVNKLDRSPQDRKKLSVENAMALDIALLLNRFSAVFEAYASIPSVAEDQIIYLRHAIDLLNGTGAQIKPEDVVYRVALEIVLFKSALTQAVVGPSAEQTNGQGVCLVNLTPLNASIVRLGKLLIDIYNDIGFINPRQAVGMKGQAEEVANAVSNMTIATTSVTVLDEAASMFLKRAAEESGFGKIVQCQGGN